MKIRLSNPPPEGGIKVTSYGGGEGSITIKGLAPEEIDFLRGAIEHGSWFVRVESAQEGGDRRLVAHPVFETFPKPAVDADMAPFWRELEPAVAEAQLELFPLEALSPHDSPSIYVSSLCGYEYTPERYAREARKLAEWGFEQMRSRRGNDGRYWEFWFLPSLWSARGDLRACIEGLVSAEPERRAIDALWSDGQSAAPAPPVAPKPPSGKEKLERALRFMQRNASFGSLSISTQKLAMVLD